MLLRHSPTEIKESEGNLRIASTSAPSFGSSITPIQKTEVGEVWFLTQYRAMKAYWGSGGVAPLILDVGTRWRWVVSFMLLPLCPQGRSTWYSLDKRLGRSRAGLDAVVKRKIPSPCMKSNPYHPARSSVLYHWANPAPREICFDMNLFGLTQVTAILGILC
jgi:hypothetical protein